MKKILIVEDSQDMQALVRLSLRGWAEVIGAASIQQAMTVLDRSEFDLILLDIELPDGTGFELCAAIKNRPGLADTPLIFLSGRAGSVDKVMGFTLGAEDYVIKPFDPMELRARLQARLRPKPEAPEPSSRPEQLQVGPVVFDLVRRSVLIEEGENRRDLGFTPIEYKILHVLARSRGQAFSRQQLIRRVWDADVHVTEDNVYSHVYSMRKKLGASSTLLECIPRVGYRLSVESLLPSGSPTAPTDVDNVSPPSALDN